MHALSRPALAARRQPADDLAGACSRRASTARAPVYRRERWTTPDGDFIDVDSPPRGRAPARAAAGAVPRPRRLVAQPLRAGLRRTAARQRGWRFAVPHFRGCSGELNLAPRAYHSGDYEEIGWILARLRAPARAAPLPRSASRSAATRCCAGPRRPATARRDARARGGRGHRRRSTWRPAATPSAAASTGWSTRACSCAR